MFKRLVLYKNFPISAAQRRYFNLIVWAGCLGIPFNDAVAGAPFAGFIRAFNFGDVWYGILVSLPAMSGILQLLGAILLERIGKRKKIFLIGGIVWRAPYILIVLLPLFVPLSSKVLLLGGVASLLLVTTIGAAVNNVSFFSWMNDILPLELRGRFFSLRQLFMVIVSFVGALGVNAALDRWTGFAGMAVIFILLAVLGVAGVLLYGPLPNIPMTRTEETDVSFFRGVGDVLKHKNYRRLLLFWAFWSFGLYMPRPFFWAFLQVENGFSYNRIFWSNTVFILIFTIVFVRVWGKWADRFGNKPVLKLCTALAALVPLFWLWIKPGNSFWVILSSCLTGMCLCGVDLCSNNMMMQLAPPKRHSFYLACFALVAGLAGSLLGGACGGLIMRATNDFFLRASFSLAGITFLNYHLLFILAPLIQFIGIWCILPKVREENAHTAKEVLQSAFNKIVRKA